MRGAVASFAYAALCIGVFVLFLGVFGITFALLNFVLRAFVEGFQLNPKGFMSGLFQFIIPSLVGLSLAFRMLGRLDPLWNRFDRWKAQE